MNNLIPELKAKGEDFEFYPTTAEIIFELIKDLKTLKNTYEYSHNFSFSSILDIGAGDGKVLKAIKKEFAVKLYAIEKAETLKELINQDVYLIGTDFYEQSLLDKDVSVTFCNPPYSEYVRWATKIIRESCSPFIYLVIPTRWKDSNDIKEAIKYREAKYKTIGEYDFLNSEDRQARAKVNLIRIDVSKEKDDAFDRFFNEEFKELKSKLANDSDDSKYDGLSYFEKQEKENKFKELVIGDNYVKTIVQLYNADINKIKKNYLSVKELDPDLLKEFDISVSKILELLKERLKGLKNLYWHELIGRMKEITERLTNKKRQYLLNTLNENGHVDFTELNIYSVVLWILKNAGDCIDSQVIDVYEEFISKANCKNYKSNEKVFEYDRWRYNDEKPTHIFLDFRLIVECWGALESDWSGGYKHNLTESAGGHIKDLLTIANNLGFKCDTSDQRVERYSPIKIWEAGKHQIFRCIYKDVNIVLFEVKAHKNGNLHIRLNQKFALALNVEYGRLKGWIHSKESAAEELSDTKAGNYFKTNFALLKSPFLMLENKGD